MAMSEKLSEKRQAFIATAQSIVDAAELEARDLTAEEDVEIANSLRSAAELDDSIKTHKDLEARSIEAADVRSKE
jgi:hypothetical protein